MKNISIFIISRYRYPEIDRYPEVATKKTLLREYLGENENILGVTLGPRYYWFMKNTRARKSHAYVPLNRKNFCSQFFTLKIIYNHTKINVNKYYSKIQWKGKFLEDIFFRQSWQTPVIQNSTYLAMPSSLSGWGYQTAVLHTWRTMGRKPPLWKFLQRPPFLWVRRLQLPAGERPPPHGPPLTEDSPSRCRSSGSV